MMNLSTSANYVLNTLRAAYKTRLESGLSEDMAKHIPLVGPDLSKGNPVVEEGINELKSEGLVSENVLGEICLEDEAFDYLQ